MTEAERIDQLEKLVADIAARLLNVEHHVGLIWQPTGIPLSVFEAAGIEVLTLAELRKREAEKPAQ